MWPRNNKPLFRPILRNVYLIINIVCPRENFSKKLMYGAKSQIIILFRNFHFNDIPVYRWKAGDPSIRG